ncbi:DNA cytosine methyltransferase [Brevundimonas diminuta]|uniref:DNA cytosine methyltransferase n=1 Tax=Brevundimonas diminuta TaxID=293 RepID=UPI0020969CF0|nr:DNA cytosine methyltransferase [Brevundimonas diminuta]MCO8020300.1 DNA cytosine methyltransferase [Brevundimonas diminuta]MCO8023278.1 DNA cytosine methyltransferase [Brevundimonas diminuta]
MSISRTEIFPVATPTAVDLFSGAGGMSWGLASAGFRIVFASDIDKPSSDTYTENHPGTPFECADVHDLSGEKILRATGLEIGELDLLAGGPPCQGFSIIGSRDEADPRNELFRQFMRIAKGLRPKALLIENVPGLMTLGQGRALREISAAYDDLGYSCAVAELLAAQYGVPQMRWRLIFVGFRKDLGVPSQLGLPKPTLGRRGIGELIPNCTISPDDIRDFLTTYDAISDLPPVGAGEVNDRYLGQPVTKYQYEMRLNAPARLANHYAPKLSAQNIARISHLQQGQDWRDLPRELLPESMKRAKLKDHTRRYRRMSWGGVPRSVITRFRDPKSGEYSHPDQNRTISIREAARIQSFPDRFIFKGPYSSQYDQVGNAVPPLLAAAIGREIIACLSGTATHRLENAFGRRRSLHQPQLALASPLLAPG